MLTFFPTPYPDETLYSVCARFHSRSGNSSPKWTFQELFGLSTVIPNMTLPSHLDAFCSRIPQLQLSVEDWIRDHTLYPLYSPFMDESRASKLKQMMREETGEGIHAFVGLSAGNGPQPNHFSFCPVCYEEDIRLFGEPYWHRIHQAPGVLTCPTHHAILCQLLSPITDRHGLTMLPISREFVKTATILPSELTDKTIHFLHEIANDVQSVLNSSHFPNLFRSKSIFLRQLAKRGFATPTGRIRQQSLTDHFLDYYGLELLEIMDSAPPGDHSWLSSATRKERRTINPVRQLLLIRFLYGSIQDFLYVETSVKYHPFGIDPFPCLNKAADHYGHLIITNCHTTRCSSTGKPVGTFRCECGFVYSRRGPDTRPEDRYTIGRIKKFGPIWQTKLDELLAKGYSFRMIARTLGVDTHTVIKYARLSEEKREAVDVTKDVVEPIGFMSKSTEGKQPSAIQSKVGKQRVNWEMRDLELSVLVEVACKQLLENSSSKPIRIRLTTVAKRLGKMSLLLQHRDKLPVTMQIFQSYEETTEDFQVRRVRWAAQQLSHVFPIKAWQIEKLAGLQSVYSERIRNEIVKHVALSTFGVLYNSEVNSNWLH
ncbi:TnsD family Tn7-like transposition protein [Brevibacillus sp. HD3.3A]|uniref:TnsD family Tn7-like transposition protein n=1 Tax=Brevibacillus sp. HD3.3A TaxID=2738979 RepID=UPI00156AA72A|nr:TnsD family Tn7-like transposition protein [Brevibacillus sp. HD3.3A]UED69443.1 TnsD family transposase [Brevibacillus sp. HD3.3A]